MTKLNEIKVYVCEGVALDMMRAYKKEIDQMVSDQDKLQTEFTELATKQNDVHEAKLHELWTGISLHVGLDPDKTWKNPVYQAETRYLLDGFGAVVYIPPSSNLFSEMFGREQSDNDPAVIETPDKGLLN